MHVPISKMKFAWTPVRNCWGVTVPMSTLESTVAEHQMLEVTGAIPPLCAY